MHQYLVNASFQLLPVVEDRHPYLWVDEAIAVIKKSGLRYEVGAFATVVEARYADVMDLFHAINEALLSLGCTEWILSFQLQARSNSDMTGEEKTAPHR